MTADNPNDPDDLDMDFTDEELLAADDLGEYDDPDSLDGEWDESAEQAPATPVKKKSSKFTIIVIVLAVLIGGGILYSMIKKPKAPDAGLPSAQTASIPAPDAQTSAVDPNSLAGIQDSQAPAPEQVPVAAPAPAQGFMNDPTQLDQAQAPSLPEQGPSMTGFADPAQAPVAAKSQGPADLPLPQTANTNTNLPNINLIKKAAPSAPEVKQETKPVPVVTPEIAPIQNAAATDAQNTALMAKLDQVMTRMDSLEKKIASQPAASSGSSANPGEIASLRIAVERLENKVSKLSEAPAVQTSSASDNSYMPDKVVVKKSVPKKRKAAPKEAAYSPAVSSKWELRSARPGEAMIGKSGQAGLQTVRLGDTVSGIGQVQAISQMGGSWVVQGTSGSISQ